MIMDTAHRYDLIVTIVNRGFAERIVTASKAVGAEGGTILLGRGTGIHETRKLLGIPIEPEKEIVMTAVPSEKTQRVLTAIVEAGELNRPGTGIAFVIELKQVAGICHIMGDRLECNPA